MITFISIFVGLVGLLLIFLSSYQWFSPQPRISSIANQLFATDRYRAAMYLPSKYSWSKGHGLALWKLRGSKQFAIVRKGLQKGQRSFFELGIGKLSIVKEVDTLDQALLLLLEIRATEQLEVAKRFEAEERYRKEQEELRLEVARAQLEENEKRVSARHMEWAKYEDRMNQLLQTLGGSNWRPEKTQLPPGITIKEAWSVVTALIDDLINDQRRGNGRIDFSEIRILIIGLVGVIDWTKDLSETNEALMWSAILSLLNDVEPGRLVSSTVLNRFAESGYWNLVYGLSVAWARIEADHLDQSRFSPLVECALGAMVRWWRITHPTDFNSALMPSELTSQIEAFTKAGTVTLPPAYGDNSIKRLDEFTRNFCR
jgi:hypothetical protein